MRQTVEPSRSGYAGWFDAKSSEIAVGEALDADTIYHELSHAWVNGRLTTERWFTEGLPQVYAAELVRRDGDEARTPTEPAADDPAARPLTEWTADDEERSVEEYGYATSFWVVDALVDEIGFDRTRDVVAALGSSASPYGATSNVERPELDWKRVYDVLVEVGDSTTAGEVFRSHVVSADDAPLIEQRDGAASGVVDLAVRSAPWDLPVGVRNRLERWEIDDVTEAIVDADTVLGQRSELESIEESVGIDEPDGADVAYAGSPMRSTGGVDFSEATARLDDGDRTGRATRSTASGGRSPRPDGRRESARADQHRGCRRLRRRDRRDRWSARGDDAHHRGRERARRCLRPVRHGRRLGLRHREAT